MAIFRKQITPATAHEAWTNVEADLQAGVLVVSAVLWPDVFHEAERLAQLHTPAFGNRSLDTLHVAAALVIRTVDFVTFDIREAALARLTGLKVKP